MHRLVQTILAPYGGSAGTGRLTLRGPDLSIDGKAITPLALLLHEAATNAAKYGSLSVAEGHVDLTVAEQGDDLVLVWQERGGPKVEGPREEGFGSRLFMATAVQLEGRVNREWREEGLRLELTLSRRAVTGRH